MNRATAWAFAAAVFSAILLAASLADAHTQSYGFLRVSVVTAFTLARSITLSAAACGLVELPWRLVESVIAASVAIAAINNLFPVVSQRIWIAAFVFGLMHGFGVASVPTDLGLPPARKLAALLAFNAGVELGPLAVVAGLLPILFWVRRTSPYTRVALPAGSMVIAVIGFLWFVQRAVA